LKVINTELPEVVIIEPTVFTDDRGFFLESYHAEQFREAGLPERWVQDNHSRSSRGVLRGLHFQEPNPQAKLVRCTRGSMWDVAVDIRVGSPTFGKWVGVELTEDNRRMLYVPSGFAHGFCALSDACDVLYKCTALYDRASDRGVVWNDPDLAIRWPIAEPRLSAKDAKAPRLKDAPVLPRYRS
jgi:dTDP-4-dehydrorhamnose 3,5-epimerase